MSTTPMQMPERVHIDESSNPYHGKFVLQPLEEGYGVTVGNALRRVLLSSTPGWAIIGMKISSVLHEFQTIPGVLEDVSEIILNLKEVRMRVLDKKPPRINFRLKGPGTWTALDIENSNPQIEVMDPDHHIATLANDADFDIELRVGRGKGYVPAEEQNPTDYPIGMIPIDAIYTPIKNVIYTVDPHRVGQKTDYEKLTIDISTDGTLTSQEALQDAAQILHEHILLFINFDEIKREQQQVEVVEEEAKEVEKTRIRRILLTPVDELELSVRAHNCLKAANIKNLAELVALNEQDLLKFRNFGRKSLTELSEVVRDNGLVFGMNVEKYIKDEPKAIVETAS
ncbi:MAG: DNA-directed RNA polymerase subunit alpha [Ignavibacteria bacterium]|nr:DNA-directed RNA polymerase subunit alpha [Ignavibacteria bacterium]